jgi:hypothetical protein
MSLATIVARGNSRPRPNRHAPAAGAHIEDADRLRSLELLERRFNQQLGFRPWDQNRRRHLDVQIPELTAAVM